jgi:hypothetical protein
VALVRSIDLVNNQLYLVTALTRASLLDVNTLVLGSLALPTAAFVGANPYTVRFCAVIGCVGGVFS